MALDAIEEDLMRLHKAAEAWGEVAKREMVVGFWTPSILRLGHFQVAQDAARRAARYAIRFLDFGEGD